MKRKFSETTTRTLYYQDPSRPTDWRNDQTAICDDAVENARDRLNDDHQGYKYSTDQVKTAMWRYLNDQIDDLLENIEDRFMDDDDRDNLLGAPEIDVYEERRLEAGDAKFDAARDARMGA